MSHVARLNFKTSRVSVYKRLSLIVGFAITVAICRRRMSLIAISFYALSPVFGPCRLSEFTQAGPHLCKVQATQKIAKKLIWLGGIKRYRGLHQGIQTLNLEELGENCEHKSWFWFQHKEALGRPPLSSPLDLPLGCSGGRVTI